MTIPFEMSDVLDGLDLFNAHRFFDAHEVLEDVWRTAPPDQPTRLHLQGLVQMAVAFHHWSSGNAVGAHSVLKRGLRNLDGAESSFSWIDFQRLRSDGELWLRYIESTCSANREREGQIEDRIEWRKENRTEDSTEHVSRDVRPDLPKILVRR